MKYYLRERFMNPLASKHDSLDHNYYVVGTLEQPVTLFHVDQEALVDRIMAAYRDSAAQHGYPPFNLTWSALQEQPNPLYAIVPADVSAPPVLGFEVEF